MNAKIKAEWNFNLNEINIKRIVDGKEVAVKY